MCCLLDCVWGRHNIGFVAVKHFMDTYASQVTVRAALLCPKSGYYPLFALIKAVALTWGTVACIDCSVVCLVQGKQLKLEHEAGNHGDVARFRVAFQQNVADKGYVYPVDDLVNRSSKRAKERTLKEGVPHDEVNVALLLPTTYMNCSGTAVRAFMQSHRWRLKKNPLALNRQDELLVVTDDVALPFGECRFKAKGGPGGQNGVRDIIKCVGTERFARLRIGVGAPHWFVGGNSGAPSGTAMDKFVLGRFNGDEQEAMPDLLRYTNELLRLYLHRGVAQATTYANSMDLPRYLKQYGASQRARRQ